LDTNTLGPFAATIGGGFIGGVLLGYAMKKVIRIAALLVGLFIAGLAFLQYHLQLQVFLENVLLSPIILCIIASV
jgi:uncharacterized membrane protein (Fun14 family)